MTNIGCTNCRQPYPDEGVPFCCPKCGGVFDYIEWPAYKIIEKHTDDRANQSSFWQYRPTFDLPDNAPLISLGEGSTPLVWDQAFGREVAYKLEFLNPTGSFKDRGSSVLVSFLKCREVKAAIEDSSGNAGASFAAYATRAGIQAKVYIPDSASASKRNQILAYGAEVVRIMGPRSNVSQVVRRAASQGEIYASHAYLPFELVGYATIAYELVEQLGEAPGTVIAPAGQGNLILSMGRGFQAMLKAGIVDRMPMMVGVQARACAPLWAVYHYGAAGMGWVTEGNTLAEGVRIKHPVRGDALVNLIDNSGGTFVAVDEDEILPGRDQLARRGLYVEPTSAVVWNGYQQIASQSPDPVIMILTGSGLKANVVEY